MSRAGRTTRRPIGKVPLFDEKRVLISYSYTWKDLIAVLRVGPRHDRDLNWSSYERSLPCPKEAWMRNNSKKISRKLDTNNIEKTFLIIALRCVILGRCVLMQGSGRRFIGLGSILITYSRDLQRHLFRRPKFVQ